MYAIRSYYENADEAIDREAFGSPDDYRFVIGGENKYWDNSELGYRKPDNYDLTSPVRVGMDHLSVEQRQDSFIEMIKGYSKEQAQKEADRCRITSYNVCYTKLLRLMTEIGGYRMIFASIFVVGHVQRRARAAGRH